MGFKRLNIAIDCVNESEQKQAQAILDELSNILRLNAGELIANAPMIRKNQTVIRDMFRTVTTQGLGVGSIAKLAQLAMKFKK